jgi:hypothetical protein
MLVFMNKRSMLIRFSNSIADLTSALGNDLDLTAEDRLSIENHLLLLQMAYTGWRGRNLAARHSRKAGDVRRDDSGRRVIHQGLRLN